MLVILQELLLSQLLFLYSNICVYIVYKSTYLVANSQRVSIKCCSPLAAKFE